MTLRIAYMTGEYPRATDTFIQREVAALRDRGVYVETFSVRRPAEREFVGPEQRAERDRTSYLLPACPWELFRSHVALLVQSPGQYLRALALSVGVRPPGIKALVWQLAYFAEAGLVARRMQRQGLIHLHNHFSNSSCSVAMLASALGGFTFSFTMHGPSEFFEPKYWRLDEKLRRALFVCCISDFCRSQGMIFAPSDRWDRMHVVHCGVDPGAFEPVRHQGRGRRILFVGRMAAVKGLPVLLDAISLLKRDHPDIMLSLAGDGPERVQLERRAAEAGLGDNARFLGYQSQAQVRQLLAETDVFAMASFAEGVPVVLMEAMAAGVPVVATRIAGIPELVEDGTSGFLVPPGNPHPLAHRIGELLADSELRNRFAGAARQKIERDFNLATETGRLCDVLDQAVQGRSVEARSHAENAVAPEVRLPLKIET